MASASCAIFGLGWRFLAETPTLTFYSAALIATTVTQRTTGGATMVKSEALPRTFARLSFTDGQVVISPRDLDVFVMSAEKAIEACHEVVKKSERFERFSEHFLAPLHTWCLNNASRVRACYLAVPSDHIPVFVVTNSRRFDFDLAEKVAAIEMQLARAGWQVNVTQLPDADAESLATFLDPEKALQIYAIG